MLNDMCKDCGLRFAERCKGVSDAPWTGCVNKTSPPLVLSFLRVNLLRELLNAKKTGWIGKKEAVKNGLIVVAYNKNDHGCINCAIVKDKSGSFWYTELCALG